MRKISPQTLSEADRRLIAGWTADCVERVIGLLETEMPGDDRPRAMIARTRAFALGQSNTADEIRRRFSGCIGTSEVGSPAAKAVARSASQSIAICHMGAHGLSAAACGVTAVGLSTPDQPNVIEDEISWQLSCMTSEVQAALRSIPQIDRLTSGPLGPGLNTSGRLGTIIRELQARISAIQ